MHRVLLLLLSLAGCAERWERPDATQAESEAAQAQCTAVAANEVPPAMVWTMVQPGTWIPGERSCWTNGGVTRCAQRGPRYIPPRYDWVDANTGQRRAARAACLQEGGWTYQGLRPLRLW